ncbi:hypothetical protein ABBQ38_001862 [Trebouxia sp. C0009 RCD-2024]
MHSGCAWSRSGAYCYLSSGKPDCSLYSSEAQCTSRKCLWTNINGTGPTSSAPAPAPAPALAPAADKGGPVSPNPLQPPNCSVAGTIMITNASTEGCPENVTTDPHPDRTRKH